jgi:hypothetical protein
MDTIRFQGVDDEFRKFLQPKRQVLIGAAEAQDLVSKYHTPDLSHIPSINEDSVRNDMFDALTDAYGVSEYFGKKGVYIPSPEYNVYIKDLDKDIHVNVYAGAIPYIPYNTDGTVPTDFTFPEIEQMKYVKFTGTSYAQAVRINSYMYRFPALAVNLPYEYYSIQEMPENIWTYDLDTKEYQFAGLDQIDASGLFMNVAKKGITEPLVLQISNGKIVSADDRSYLMLLIATYLHLPTVPAVLYMVRNNSASNMLTSRRQIDIINEMKGMDTGSDEEIALINPITNPYMTFYKKNVNNNILDSMMNGAHISTEDIINQEVASYDAIAFFKDEGADPCDDVETITDEELKALHAQKHAEEREKIRQSLENYLNSL